jgi:hypothetical protein
VIIFLCGTFNGEKNTLFFNKNPIFYHNFFRSRYNGISLFIHQVVFFNASLSFFFLSFLGSLNLFKALVAIADLKFDAISKLFFSLFTR